MTTKHTDGAVSKEVEITDLMYQAYGSDTGVLFGIPAELRSSVKAIVRIAIRNSIDQKTATERDRLRGALVDCEKVMHVSANKLATPLSSRNISAVNKHLVECVIRTRTVLANWKSESGEKAKQ